LNLVELGDTWELLVETFKTTWSIALDYNTWRLVDQASLGPPTHVGHTREMISYMPGLLD
jgi:hypothetical protein